MRALAAVHLTAHNALGVLYGNAALGIVHENNDPNHREEQDDEERGKEEILSILRRSLHRLAEINIQGVEGGGKTGDDTGKQQDRNTVSNALVVDLLAQPHHQRRAGGENHDDDDGGEHLLPAFRVHGNRLDGAVRHGHGGVAQIEIVRCALNKAQQNGHIAGDGRNLLAALLAFLRHPLQRRNRDGQQLHDNGAVDIGAYAHGEQRRVGERAAGQHVKVAQGGTALRDLGHHLLKSVRVQERHRNHGAEAEHNDNQKGKQDLLAQFGNTPGVLNCFEQFRSPLPSHLRLRSSALQLRNRH